VRTTNRSRRKLVDRPRLKICRRHPKPVHYDEGFCPACKMAQEVEGSLLVAAMEGVFSWEGAFKNEGDY